MKIRTQVMGLIVLITAITLIVSSIPAFAGGGGNGAGNQNQGEGGGGSVAGNCLSYPVIWAEGVTKILRGEFEVVDTNGEVWWWWGTWSDGTPLSCLIDPDDETETYCDDGVEESVGTKLPGDLPSEIGTLSDDPAPPDIQPLRKVWVQHDSLNEWQAESADWSDNPVNIDRLDWGDSIESVDWTINSKVRCEMSLYKDIDPESPMLQYLMYHVDGWGITELWGISKDGDVPVLDDGLRASVYTPCGRLTIQKLLVLRENLDPDSLTWDSTNGLWTGENINPPIFNEAVHEAVVEGMEGFPAEINVKGKVMYGYTWSVRDLFDPAINPDGTGVDGTGDYRLTFSLDSRCGLGVDQNTFFIDGVTDFVEIDEVILAPAGGVTISDEPVNGATAVLDFVNDLTYINIRIA